MGWLVRVERLLSQPGLDDPEYLHGNIVVHTSQGSFISCNECGARFAVDVEWEVCFN